MASGRRAEFAQLLWFSSLVVATSVLFNNNAGDGVVRIVLEAEAIDMLAELTIGRNKSAISVPISGCAEKYPDKHSFDG